MRPTRAALLVVATALTPALLFTAPAFAAGPQAPATTVSTTSDTPVDEMSEAELRTAITDILADENSGVAVVREANKALSGTVEDMRAFLKTGYRLAQAEDDRVAVAHILFVATANGDKRVIREANQVLDDGSPEALRAWLETGYVQAQAEDDRVAVAHILYLARANGDKRVAQEANEVVGGTPEELRAFRQTGYRLAQAEDDAVYIFRLLADPKTSDALRAAAEAALDDGSPEALRHFRTIGQYEVGD
ncbi:ALF repeat-containing protein [Streptomyces sp. NPDC087843]|uniref:ALF repeat-containing protein n=1 Tax=Streptomyces sp. NPDC087843 TaxID=3365804 RepID=UPI003815575D